MRTNGCILCHRTSIAQNDRDQRKQLSSHTCPTEKVPFVLRLLSVFVFVSANFTTIILSIYIIIRSIDNV